MNRPANSLDASIPQKIDFSYGSAWPTGNKYPNADGSYTSSNGRVFFVDNEDRIHREDGPAYTDGREQFYYCHGILHNENGPAIILRNGSKFYYLNGVEKTEHEFKTWRTKQDNFIRMKEIVAKMYPILSPEEVEIYVRNTMK